MNEQTNTPMLPPPTGVAEWFSVWRDAVTRPNEQTFARIAQSPNAKLTTALLWIFLGSLVNFLLASLVQGQMARQMMQNFGMEGVPDAGGGLIAAICGAPIAAVISVVLTALMVGVVQLIAKMFGGRGTFEQLMYAIAAILTPFSILSGLLTLLAAIPYAGACFGIVGLVVGIYALVLEIMAVKGVNQFGWGQAAASLLLPFLVLCCCLTVGTVAIINVIRTNMPGIFDSFPTPIR